MQYDFCRMSLHTKLPAVMSSIHPHFISDFFSLFNVLISTYERKIKNNNVKKVYNK